MESFKESTSYLGTAAVDYFRSILDKLNKKLLVISHKDTFRISEADYNNFSKVLTGLEHSIDDMQFAFDKRATQTGLDDLLININLCTVNTRNLASIYNFNKIIWELYEIGVPSTVIEDIQAKKEKYREKYHTDPYKLSRKWYKKVSAGFQLICKNCGFVHKDVDLIEAQSPDKSSRRNPE